VGALLFGRVGVIVLPVGGLAGWELGRVLSPRRHTLRLDAAGVHVGRLNGVVHVPWPDVVAFGVEDAWSGRRGRSTALGICRRGSDWPVMVPALTFHASGFRVGGEPPETTLAPYRAGLLTVVGDWAKAHDVRLVPTGLDDWWDHHRS
jgi:hypothetical protein